MNDQHTDSITMPLPSGITFEVPRDYAKYCGGQPLRVLSVPNVDDGLTISWNAQVIRFVHSGTTIEIDRESVLGLVVNEAEVISGMEACTVRVGLTDKDGSKMTYPIFSANPRMKSVFIDTVNMMRSFSLPVRIFSTPQLMLKAK
jgi:hypothetical protein